MDAGLLEAPLQALDAALKLQDVDESLLAVKRLVRAQAKMGAGLSALAVEGLRTRHQVRLSPLPPSRLGCTLCPQLSPPPPRVYSLRRLPPR